MEERANRRGEAEEQKGQERLHKLVTSAVTHNTDASARGHLFGAIRAEIAFEEGFGRG